METVGLLGKSKLKMCAIVSCIALLLSACGDSVTSPNYGPTGNNVDSRVTLSWVAPTVRVDDTPVSMSEIAGYKVYMGDNKQDLSVIVDINDPYTMDYQIDNLTSGIHFFAVTAYSVSGIESGFSPIVSKAIGL
jgi:hypothetical protein